MRTDRIGPAADTAVPPSSRPALSPHVRLRFDPVRERHVLLGPESVSVLNGTAADVLQLCDGRRTVAEIETELCGRYDRVAGGEVRDFLARLTGRRLLELRDG